MSLFRYSSVPVIAAALALTVPGPVHAETIAATPGTEASQLASLPTGDQLALQEFSGTLDFAGQRLELSNFTGLLGYATELAYALTLEGTARVDGERANRGRMLLIAPFGQGIVVERFDATRLHRTLASSANAAAMPHILSSLRSLAGGQRRGLFLGRLGRTDFNVATMGSGAAELARRSRVGGTAIREARFSAPAAGIATEQAIVEKFVAALVRGDAASVGQFLDPLPFGFSNLEQGGDAARSVMAAQLLRQHDWKAFANRQVSQSGETQWIVQGSGPRATINLRRTTDFAFVQSIQVGE